jgi:hypothetical protein
MSLSFFPGERGIDLRGNHPVRVVAHSGEKVIPGLMADSSTELLPVSMGRFASIVVNANMLEVSAARHVVS